MHQIMLTISPLLVPIAAIANPLVQSGTVQLGRESSDPHRFRLPAQQSAPTVLFDGTKLKVDSSSDALIVAKLPSKAAAGTFRLTVKDSLGNFANFDLTYGAAGPQGRRPKAAKRATGERGPEGNWSYWAARTERACWSARWCVVFRCESPTR
jgi:hypothetical protein